MPKNFISRGVKRSSPLGSTIFVCARALDPFLQYSILAQGVSSILISRLGGTIKHQGLASNTGIAHLDSLQLSPYRLILLGMAVCASAKHIYWQMFIANEEMPVSIAIAGGVFNATLNSINDLMFILASTSPAVDGTEYIGWFSWPSLSFLIGSLLFVTRIAAELVSEIQRKRFKESKDGRGKPYTNGLFGLARHINYAGYTFWRTGYAFAGGGRVWGLVVGLWFTYDFSTRAIPALDEYCEQRYEDKWTEYKATTRYKLFPYIY